MISGIVNIVSKLLDRFMPSRVESLRNKIYQLEKERDAILQSRPNSRHRRRLPIVLAKLHEAEQQLKNRVR